MAIEKIHIDKFLDLARTQLLIDVRSPGEYNHAHIPGAYNIPLFTDEERKIVGTIYKQESREKAIKAGLDFFGPKMKAIVEEAEQLLTKPDLSNRKNILIYCWRGGMRSAAIAWLLDLYGFKVYTLTGGYKRFRNYALDTFKFPFEFQIVGGYTGSGKTGVLHELRKRNERVIDLEALAHHKGSAFGNLGMDKQPGQEMFENRLALALQEEIRMEDNRGLPCPIWMEDESQRIGLINIPNHLWQTMRGAPLYFIKLPFEERLAHIAREYGQLNREGLIDAIGRIRNRLGSLQAKTAIELLESDNTIESFRILLKYYDKFYLKALHNRNGQNSLIYLIHCESVTPENATSLVRQPKYQPEKP